MKIIPFLLSAALVFPSLSYTNSYAQDAADTYTVTFFDFDGNVMNVQELKSGETIDYSKPDTNSLKSNLDAFTQRMFSEWDTHPDTVTQDTNIYALYTEAVISLDNVPTKTLYSLDDEIIDPSGLKVTITINTQTTSFDGNGNRIINTEVTDISSTCTLSPNSAKEAFADCDTAEIKIYPISSSVPVGTYTVKLDFLRGDVNFDGVVDASDASAVIHHYASCSMGVYDGFTDIQKRAADMNCDGIVNASDASDILIYYSKISSGKDL